MSEFRVDQIKNQAGTRGPDVAGITTFSGVSGIVMPSGSTEYRGGRDRAIRAGGIITSPATARVDNIDYVNVSTTGNATDFGNLSTNLAQGGACASSTRGIVGGCTPNGSSNTNNIEYITISSTGNAFDFGDFTKLGHSRDGASNNTRGIFFGRASNPLSFSDIEYITIATLGNAIDFGDSQRVGQYFAACASSTRGCYSMDESPSPVGVVSDIDYIQFASVGNAIDFGDLSQARTAGAAGSNGHGGL